MVNLTARMTKLADDRLFFIAICVISMQQIDVENPTLAANHMADWTRDELSRLNGRKQVSLSIAEGSRKTSKMLLITANNVANTR